MFSEGDQASESALEKHVPAGIVARRGIKYSDGRDELFDLYYFEKATGPQPTIVWVHGGGCLAGSKEGIANYVKVLAMGNDGCAGIFERVWTTYPKPVEQVNAALAFLLASPVDFKIAPAAVVLSGDSAGAHISSQVALITTDPAYATPVNIQPKLPLTMKALAEGLPYQTLIASLLHKYAAGRLKEV